MSLTRVGTSILWEIEDDVFTTSAVLKSHGFEGWTPRNNFSESLNKAVKTVRRDWDVRQFGADIPKRIKQAKHTRYKETSEEARVAFHVPRVNGNDFSIDVAAVIVLDKKTGSLSYVRESIQEHEFHELADKISAAYRLERDRVNSDEFRRFVSRYATGMTGCNGIPLRASGGAYFVPAMFDERLAKLKAVCQAVNGVARIITIPVYDDEESSVALEAATTGTFESRMKTMIEKLQADVAKGLSPRAYEFRLEEVEELRQQIESFKKQTRSHAATFESKMQTLYNALESGLGNVKDNIVVPFDLMAELDKIGGDQ